MRGYEDARMRLYRLYVANKGGADIQKALKKNRTSTLLCLFVVFVSSSHNGAVRGVFFKK